MQQNFETVILSCTYCPKCHQPLAEYRRMSESGMMFHQLIRHCKNKECEDYVNLDGTQWHETAPDWQPEKPKIEMHTAMLGIVPGEMKRKGIENSKKFGKKW